MRYALALVLLLLTGVAHAREQSLIPGGATPKLACGGAAATWRNVGGDEQGFADRVTMSDMGTGCARTQLLLWHFSTSQGTPRLVTLRARYQHGFVAWLDGKEIARRRLPPGATEETLASDVHGPEWERIPLVGVSLAAGEHVLAVEAHPRTAGREPAFDAELSASDAPRIVHGPYLLSVTTHSAQLAFETDEPTRATVEFGATQLAQSVTDGLALRHVVTLAPLHAATSYGYRVHIVADDEDVSSERIDFHTEPERGRPLRFVAYGDVRSGHDVHAEISRSIVTEDPDLVVSTGDLVDMGSDDGDWDKYFEVAAPLLRSVPVYVAAGNHDFARGGRGEMRFRTLFDLRGPTWRSFDVAGVHFVALDSDHFRAPEQLAWLRLDLERARGARAVFAFMHEGPFSSGMHGDNDVAKAQYVPLLEQAGVALVISGHDHDYERGRVGKLDYLVTGGGGAELRTQRCGVPGRKPCPPRMQMFINDHNYVVIDVLPKLLRICPKRPDATALEPCFTRPLAR